MNLNEKLISDLITVAFNHWTEYGSIKSDIGPIGSVQREQFADLLDHFGTHDLAQLVRQGEPDCFVSCYIWRDSRKQL